MVNPLPLVLIAVIAGVVGWQALQKFSPETAEGLTDVAVFVSGRACPPSVLRDPVFMPLGEDCEPVAKMLPAPRVAGPGPDEAHNAILQTMINPRALGDYRQIRIQRRYLPAGILTGGRAAPDSAAGKSTFFATWSKAQVKETCALLPAGFALDCMKLGLSGDFDPLWQGQPVLLEFRLTYTAAEEVGPLPVAATPDAPPPVLSHTSLALPAKTAPLADLVTRATTAASQACATIREETGNCMISDIAIDLTGATDLTLYSVAPAEPEPAPAE